MWVVFWVVGFGCFVGLKVVLFGVVVVVGFSFLVSIVCMRFVVVCRWFRDLFRELVCRSSWGCGVLVFFGGFWGRGCSLI